MGASMSNGVDLVRSSVLLNSYSSSPNFVGFCSSRVGYGDEEYEKLLLNAVLLLLRRIELVSSLNIGISLEDHAKEYSLSKSGIACRDALLANGVISNRLDEPPLDYFHFDKEVTEDIALDLIRFQTSLGGASGHSFFLDAGRGVIIYPHDDCGLGFILGGDPDEKATKLDMLKSFLRDNSSLVTVDLKNATKVQQRGRR